jgi:hypothetical protein
VGNRRKIIGIYEVMSGLTSDAYPPPYNERWSYAVKVKMLSEAFSRNWAANSVTLDDIVRDYVKTSQANVTLKRRNLNCLSYGHDKVQVTEEFAEFLIGKIM